MLKNLNVYSNSQQWDEVQHQQVSRKPVVIMTTDD